MTHVLGEPTQGWPSQQGWGTLFLQERIVEERGLCSVKTNEKKESVKRPELVGVPVVHVVQ